MNLNATYDIPAPSERVWDLLMDVDAIGRCLPGSRGLRPIGPDRYEVELGVTVAELQAKRFGVHLVNIAEPKEGPSAGLAIALAMLSAATGLNSGDQRV